MTGRHLKYIACVLSCSLAAFQLGCEVASEGIPTKTASKKPATSAAPKKGTSAPQGPNDMQGMDPAQMAGMTDMMGEGPEFVDGAPDGIDTASEFAAQSSLEAPDAGPPGSESELLGGGGFGAPQDPALGGAIPGAPEGEEGGAASYLESGGGGFGAYDNPENYDALGNYVGPKVAVPAAGAQQRQPAAGRTREDVLRNRNNAQRQIAGAAPGRTSPRSSSGVGQGALVSLSNPVMNYDGTGFAIGFSADYQLLRSPEKDAKYVWVVAFTEQSKTGTGSRPRLFQTPIQLRDSGSLQAVFPLQGKPKGPYRCMIASQKNGRTQQLTKWVNFPQ